MQVCRCIPDPSPELTWQRRASQPPPHLDGSMAGARSLGSFTGAVDVSQWAPPRLGGRFSTAAAPQGLTWRAAPHLSVWFVGSNSPSPPALGPSTCTPPKPQRKLPFLPLLHPRQVPGPLPRPDAASIGSWSNARPCWPPCLLACWCRPAARHGALGPGRGAWGLATYLTSWA
jgi:hypothetical protein